MKPLRIVQLGVLHEHSDGIMKTLRERMTDVFEVVAIAAENNFAEELHREDPWYRGLRWCGMDEILDLPGLDAVFVETEMRMLVPAARKCLEHGLPVHIDKPGGEELEPYASLVRDFYKAGLLFQPGYMLRTNPGLKFIREAVRKGWIGEVWEIDANMHRSGGSAGFRRWFSEYSGGTMFNYGSHLVDALLDLMGEPLEIRPYHRNVAGDGVNDSFVTVFIYPKAIATLRASMCSPQPLPHRRFTVRGTKGMLELLPLEAGYDPILGHPKCNGKPMNIHAVFAEDNDLYRAGTYDIPVFPENDRFEDQLREFAGLLRSGKPSPHSADREIQTQRVLLAASGYL